MKKREILIIVVILLFTSCLTVRKHQIKSNSTIDMIEYRMKSCYVKRRVPVSYEHLKKRPTFYFFKRSISGAISFCELDYKDWDEKLKLSIIDTTTRFHPLNSIVYIHFKGIRKIELVFDIYGNYRYEDIWYIKNDELFFGLFCYVSNNIINYKIIEDYKNRN